MSKFVKTKNKKANKAVTATVTYDAKFAKSSTNTDYYKAQGQDMREYEKLQEAKVSLATPKWEVVSGLLESFRSRGLAEEKSSSGMVLLGIYQKNQQALRDGVNKNNSNLISVISKPELLALAYREIRGNKGALTPGAEVSSETYNSMSDEQKQLYLASHKLPDGINLSTFVLISKLLRQGKYPWGSSKRIYFDKPGQPGKKRPITIPPFTDRIVQKAISMVLESIYEPFFDKLNCSFGFRPTFGTQDALVAVCSKYTNGVRTAVEGDIEAAYDTVNKEKLLEILGKKIKDKKFISLLRERLNYDFVETSEDGSVRVKPVDGIPQGGIDSPYLFNIYMHELDTYVKTELQASIDNLNQKLEKPTGYVRKYNKNFNSIRAHEAKLIRQLGKLKAKLSALPRDNRRDVHVLRKRLFGLVKAIRYNNHQKNRISSATTNKKVLRIHYFRYADDWILLTNGSKEIGTALKNKISQFLTNNLGLKLSPTKTLITDITKNSAKFLGCELRISARGALRRKPVNKGIIKKYNLQKISGLQMWAKPDRQRLINRMYMKGFCSRSGFPQTIPWLSCLEAHTIIERFNASIRGLAEFYFPIIKYKSHIIRWIYILRFSCLKTLAQKFHCSIKDIFKRFGYNLHCKSTQTVKVRVVQTVNKKSFAKDWVLLTYNDLLRLVNYEGRAKKMLGDYYAREKGETVNNPVKRGSFPKVTNDNFLEKISWVSFRTSASLNMPCSYCGSDRNVHQHHIRHIRKRSYSLIPDSESYQRIMALRNRKQIPLCEVCHISLIHGGKYNGPKLIKLAPVSKLVDNRILHVESFVHPGTEHFSATLAEKGWKDLKQMEKN